MNQKWMTCGEESSEERRVSCFTNTVCSVDRLAADASSAPVESVAVRALLRLSPPPPPLPPCARAQSGSR
jgi:hypothetical protein